MERLPEHGRIECTKCFKGCTKTVTFDQTKRTEGDWRITNNPLAWGNSEPEIIVLGFSKGPTQAGALSKAPHDEIAYKGSRLNVGKILQHVGLISKGVQEDLGQTVSQLIADKNGKFHFGSMIRCTVERQDKGIWKGSGGGMLDKFVATPFGQEAAVNCVSAFLKCLPSKTKLIVMFGMGTKGNYIKESFKLYQSVRGGDWRWLNDVAYTDGKVTVVHVEHFASQGKLIPQWLGLGDNARGKFGVFAAETVANTLSRGNTSTRI